MIRLLLVVAMTACSPAAWRPPADAETVRVDGDLIVRGESDGTISVTARVMIDDASAAGFVRLRDAELSTAAGSKHVRLARARAWHALAVILAADPERSLQAAKRGIDEFDQVAFVRNDDLTRANFSIMSKDLPRAASKMTSSLHATLRSYVRRFHAEVW